MAKKICDICKKELQENEYFIVLLSADGLACKHEKSLGEAKWMWKENMCLCKDSCCKNHGIS